MYNIIKNQVIAIVPARSGSKGVIHKNIKTLGGYPLLAFSVAVGKKAESIDRVIISSDSTEYIGIGKTYGAEAPFIRPVEISRDESTDYQCVKHLLDFLQDNEGQIPEYVVHLRPTTPFRDPVLIDAAVKKIKLNSKATALRSAHEMSETAYKCLEIENSIFKPLGMNSFNMDNANLPRQMFPKTYAANGYVDIYKSNFIETNCKMLGNHVIPYIIPLTLEVDNETDFMMLEHFIKDNNLLIKKIFQ